METLNLPETHIAPLAEYDDVQTVGMPPGVALVKKGHLFGLFSLEKGALVLPVEFNMPILGRNGIFLVSTWERGAREKSGLYALARDEFVVPLQECRITLADDYAYVYPWAAQYGKRVFGIYSLRMHEWVLPLEKEYMLGDPTGRTERNTYNGEEFLLVHDTKEKSKPLGLFSLTRGFIFEPVYESLFVHVAPDMLCATAIKGQLKECFVVQGGDSWKTPPVVEVLQIAPPFFVVEVGGTQFHGGYCLYDGRDEVFYFTGCHSVFSHKNLFIGVNKLEASTTIYDVDTGHTRFVGKVSFATSIDDDRWIVSGRQGFGVFSLVADAVIIPPVFESLAHIHGDFFFARWQGKSLIIDLSKGELQLTLKLGAPPKPPMPMDGWNEFMPGIFVVDPSLILGGPPATPSP